MYVTNIGCTFMVISSGPGGEKQQ